MEFVISYATPDIGIYLFQRESECKIIKIDIRENYYGYVTAYILFEWLEENYEIEIESNRIILQDIIDSIKNKLKEINYQIEEKERSKDEIQDN